MDAIGKLVLMRGESQDQEFVLGEGSVNVGRGTTNEIVLQDPKVSRLHARIDCSASGCTLKDLGSANGIRVNGAKVDQATLKPGDLINMGDSTLRFDIAQSEPEAEMTRIESLSQLDVTLTQAAVPVALPDTHSPHLVIHTPDLTWRVPFDGEQLTIGRSTENEIPLEFPQVSRHHARIERRAAAFVLRDLKSRNGTWVGQQRVDEYPLQNGDSIRIGPAQLIFKAPFDAEDLTIVDSPLARRQHRAPVVMVPGLMGSEMWLGNTRVWPNVRLMFSQPEIFRLPEKDPLEARSIIGQTVIVPNLIKLDQYNRFGDFLEETLGYERGNDLFEFGYDWRQDVRQSARKLAEAIERWDLKPPIVLVGHSLGCLVSRYYIERLGGKQKVGRMLMMASPYSGVPAVLTTLLTGPNLLPFGLLGERLRAVLSTFPSLYQDLPTWTCGVNQAGNPINFYEDDTWLPEARRPLLYQGREYWREVGNRLSVPTVSVFGYGLKTVTGAKVVRDTDGLCQRMEIRSELKGDDSVPERSAVMEGTEIHPVLQHHGSLYVDNDVKMRLKMELSRDIE